MNLDNCFICGSTVEKVPVKDLIYCHTCDIFRRSEILSRDELKEDGKDFLLSACHNPVTRASRMNDAKGQLDVLDKYMNPGKLYDIGAAGGFFMKAAKDRGWEVSGNELSSAGVKWAKDNLDLDIFCGFLEDDTLPENHFDVIVMWNTLEHLDYPLNALKQCYKSLNDNGYVFIKVPCKGMYDIDDVENRYEYLHLTEFSRDGLVKMLSKSGFSVELETYDNDCGRHIMVLAKKQNTLMEKFNELMSAMSNKIPFCLVRFNDGEMMGVKDGNVVVARGDQYVDNSLQNALKEALAYRDINYWIGVPCENCWPEHRRLADTFVAEDYAYRTSAVVLTNENWQRAQKEIIENIGDRPVWIISGQGQNWDSFNLKIERHIKVPEKDAWASKDDVMNIWEDASPGAVVLISCGPLSRILAYEWWKNRQDCTVIDVGSTFDPFTRGISHKCHKWSNGKNETNWCPSCNSAGKDNKQLVSGFHNIEENNRSCDFSDAPLFGREKGLKKSLEILHGLNKINIIIVETGTTRGVLGGGVKGDGWATLAWGWYCQKYGGKLVTIDYLNEAIENCKSITSKYAEHIDYVVNDSVEYLKGFSEKIDLLYLDSCDDPNHILNELKAVYGNLKDDSIILIDDTDSKSGKGKLSIEYLRNNGWDLEFINECRQVMATRSQK